MTDSFAHRLRLDQIRDGERIDLIADTAERAAIAQRLALDGLDRLEAHVTLSKTGEVIRAEGRLTASLNQSCVITGDPIGAHIDEPFAMLFTPEPQVSSPDEEIELAEQDCDLAFHDGSTIDLGSAIADTLALSINPYPRSAGAEAALKEAGVMTEMEASPFAVLAKLKKSDDS